MGQWNCVHWLKRMQTMFHLCLYAPSFVAQYRPHARKFYSKSGDGRDDDRVMVRAAFAYMGGYPYPTHKDTSEWHPRILHYSRLVSRSLYVLLLARTQPDNVWYRFPKDVLRNHLMPMLRWLPLDFLL